MPATVPNAFIFIIIIHFPKDNCSVHFSCSVVSDSLRSHGLQHTRLHCPPLSSRVCSDSCPLRWWCCLTSHLLLPSSPFAFSIFSITGVFSSESALCIRWPKYWSFSFSISPFNEYLGLISYRIDWFDLLAVQGTLKSLFQQHSFSPTLTSIRDYWKSTLGLFRPLLAKWCLCCLIHCLGLS